MPQTTTTTSSITTTESTTTMKSQTSDLVLLAATLLRIPARRLRALALGDDGALRDWLANESATSLARARRDARIAFARIGALGARVVALGDESYPAGLRDLRDPPPFLIVRGTLSHARSREGTAIVGTREPDVAAEAFAFALAGSGVATPIVSGLALGIDAAAHRGALAAGASTYAYVGHGLGATYPPEHRALEEEIVAGGGAILTESLPDESVSRWSLVRRDRLQAAHAASIVLVASDADGGAMHAMKAARELGRDRFALAPPCRLDDRYSGNRRSIGEGAISLASNSADARASIHAAARARAADPVALDATQPRSDRPNVNPFQPFDLSKASAVEDIDALPFGVIVVDRVGTILEYNTYESEMTGFGRERVLGRNFFHDVAPCTALHEFEGRFGDFMTSRDTSIEPFEFIFPFSRGEQKVTVLFVRLNFESERATICVVRRVDAAVPGHDGSDIPSSSNP